jgi:hypothetical protein
MKTGLLLVTILCLLLGCTASRRDPSNTAQISGLSSPPDPAAPELQTAPRGKAPPFISMTGEFRKPGRYAWTHGMTLKDAIDAAGGFTDFARRRLRIRHWDGSEEG